MATDKPRITSYVDPELYEKLESFKEETGSETLSKAVATALEDYFGMKKKPIKSNQIEINNLKKELKNLRDQLNNLSKKIREIESKSLEEE